MGLGGFIDRLVTPTNSLGQLGQAFLAASGGPIGGAFQSLIQQRQFGQQHGLAQQLQQAQLAHMQRQDTQPLIEHAGEDVVTLDPKDFHEIGRIHGTPAPDEFDRIAIAAGVLPGTPEYQAAARGRLSGLSDPPQAVQGFDARGRPTITFYHRSDASGAPSGPRAPPAIGEIRGNHVYRGGPPGNPASWQPVTGGYNPQTWQGATLDPSQGGPSAPASRAGFRG